MTLGEVIYRDMPQHDHPEALAALRLVNWPEGWEPFAKANDEVVDVGAVHAGSGRMLAKRYGRSVEMSRITAEANETIREGLMTAIPAPAGG